MSKLAQEVQRLVDELHGKPEVSDRKHEVSHSKIHPTRRNRGGGGRPAERPRRPTVTVRKPRKPIRRSKKTQAKHDAEGAVITQVRAEVFDLDPACICGRCKSSTAFDEMNEVETRAQTRGLPPEDRFNAGTCVRMSRRCHRAFHGTLGQGKTLFLRFLDPQLRANGPIEVRHKGGSTHVYQRQPSALQRWAASRQGDEAAAPPSGVQP